MGFKSHFINPPQLGRQSPRPAQRRRCNVNCSNRSKTTASSNQQPTSSQVIHTKIQTQTHCSNDKPRAHQSAKNHQQRCKIHLTTNMQPTGSVYIALTAITIQPKTNRPTATLTRTWRPMRRQRHPETSPPTSQPMGTNLTVNNNDNNK